MEEKLKEYLQKHNIKYNIHEHPAVFTVEQSKNNPEIQKIPGLRTKSLFLKDENNNYYLVCLPGEKRLDMKLLKKELNIKELHFASAEELKAGMDLTPGSVSIFGMINSKNAALIIGKSVWDAKKTGFHPNINTATLEIAHEDLEKFVNSLKCRKFILQL